MYNKLLISAGGGIISRDHQVEQNESATIVIGLGGTGIDCLKTLKKEVYNRIKPDNNDAILPTYNHIKFLAIDSERYSLSDLDCVCPIDSNTEFLDISCTDIASLLTDVAILKKPSLQWLKSSATQPDGCGISFSCADKIIGTRGVKQVGRLLFFQNISLFVQKLTNMILDTMREFSASTELNIHIFTGLSGGTGAGIYLDVCYIIQYVLETLGLHNNNQILGYFFLPDVNLSNDKLCDPAKEWIKCTGFASMKELD